MADNGRATRSVHQAVLMRNAHRTRASASTGRGFVLQRMKGGRAAWYRCLFALCFIRDSNPSKNIWRKTDLPDLFGDKDKKDDWVVAVTSVNGQVVFGTNSDVWNYPDSDDATAKRLRGILIEKVPDMNRRHLGRKPNDVVFHAETAVLLRAAKVNGGTLAGQTLEVVVNQPMCNVCKMILPHIGMELGNPVAFFTDVTGARRKMHNGAWQNLE